MQRTDPTGAEDNAARWPSFSIVVPTFERRDLVCDVLRAIDRIEYAGRFDVVVAIDGSRDGTKEAIAELDLRTAPCVLFHENNGPAFTRNRGAMASRGDIILFLDDDMICRRDILVAHAARYAAGADAVLGDIPLDPQSPPGFLSAAVGAWAAERRAKMLEAGEIETVDLLGGHFSVRRSAFEALGGFDGRFTEGGRYGNEDLDFGVRLAARFDVRFAADAVAFQRYVVTPRQNLRQCFDAGQTDVLFAAKHPALAGDVFAPHRPRSKRVRFVLRPMAAVPGLPGLLAFLTSALARKIPPTGKSSHCFAMIFANVRELVYWAGVRKGKRILQ